MKKQYIVPAIYGHKLSIESQILATSPKIRTIQTFGNKASTTMSPSDVDYLQADYGPEVIKSVEDDESHTTSNI